MELTDDDGVMRFPFVSPHDEDFYVPPTFLGLAQYEEQERLVLERRRQFRLIETRGENAE